MRSNSFVNGSSYGVAVLSSSTPIVIDKNVFYGLAITINTNSYLKNNMFVSVYSSSAEIRSQASTTVVEDNFFSGVSFYYSGEECSGGNLIKNNVIYAGGVSIRQSGAGCIRISNFVIVGSPNVGIYYIGEAETIIESNTIISAQVGTFVYIYAPPSTQHIAGTKKSLIRNNIIIGRPPIYQCSSDDFQYNTYTGAGPNYDSKIGVTWSQFLDSYDWSRATSW